MASRFHLLFQNQASSAHKSLLRICFKVIAVTQDLSDQIKSRVRLQMSWSSMRLISRRLIDSYLFESVLFRKVKISFARDDGNKKYSMSSLGNGDQHSVIRLLMLSHLTKHLYDFEVDSQKYKFNATICMARKLKCPCLFMYSFRLGHSHVVRQRQPRQRTRR